MTRYIATIGIPGLFPLGFFGLANIAVDIDVAAALTSVFWLSFWVAILYAILGLWGITAVWLERQQKVLITEEAVIPTDSWHYRFNHWMASSGWKRPETECQYWALTVNNILFLFPIAGVGIGIIGFCFYVTKLGIIWPGGFLLGFVPEWQDWREFDFEEVRFRYDGLSHTRQGVGPTLGLSALAGVFLWLNPAFLPFSGIIALFLAGGLVFRGATVRVLGGFALLNRRAGRVVFVSGIGSILAFLLTRRLVCRHVRYI